MKEICTLGDLERAPSAETGDERVRLGVFGDPVAHSLSPAMQNAALEACGLSMRYGRFQIAPADLSRALRLLPRAGFLGVNLTIPHKIAAVPWMDELDDAAERIGAVNTVIVDGDRLIGSNTDGRGFSRAIRSEFAVDLRDLRVLLFGAGGGAGRAIAMQCAAEGCERLVLVNRTPDKARQLAAELKPFFDDVRVAGPVPRLESVPWEENALRHQIAHSDLLVNATPLGMRRSDSPLLAPALLAPHLMVYDTVYSRTRTPLLAAAADAGARGANGLSMLLEQGALSFEKWFDRDPPIAKMRAALESAFRNG